jgi:diguanylate cyclase (GGDEF)-like protein
MGFQAVYNLVALDLFAALLLAAILCRLVASLDRIDRPLRIFVPALPTVLMPALDAAVAAVDARPAWRTAAAAFYALFYAVQSLAPLFWLLYCLEQLPAMVWPFGKRVAAAGWPLLLAAAAGGRLPRRTRRALIAFGLPPGIGGRAQTLAPGISARWPAVALSLILSYLLVESELMAVDCLTSLQNRRSLNHFPARRIQDFQAAKPFAACMIDFDRFKAINDNWGHQSGDAALQDMARILRGCFHHQDSIARYAGDEFVAVFDVAGPADLAAVRARLDERLAAANRRTARECRPGISVGGALCGPEAAAGAAEPADQAAKSFLNRIDAPMYADKRAKATDFRTKKNPDAGPGFRGSAGDYGTKG